MNNSRQNSLQELIDRLTQIVHGNHKMRGFPFGDNFLNHKQVLVLFFLSDKINVTSVKEIAKFLHVTPGAVTQLIDGLVDKKLVKREEDSSDRRVINIKLTKTTKDRFEDFKKKYFVAISHAFKDLSDIEIGQLIKLINKVKISED